MVIFHSYVSLPEGNWFWIPPTDSLELFGGTMSPQHVLPQSGSGHSLHHTDVIPRQDSTRWKGHVNVQKETSSISSISHLWILVKKKYDVSIFNMTSYLMASYPFGSIWPVIWSYLMCFNFSRHFLLRWCPIPAPRSQLFRSGEDRLAEADALLLLSQASYLGPLQAT